MSTSPQQRLVSVALALALAATALTASLAIAHEAGHGHDTFESDCPLCQIMAASNAALTMASTEAASGLATVAVYLIFAPAIGIVALRHTCWSLVSQKTRLDI